LTLFSSINTIKLLGKSGVNHKVNFSNQSSAFCGVLLFSDILQHMSLGMSLGQSLEQSPHLEHRIELKLELVQKFQQYIEETRDEVEGPPEEILKRVLEKVINSVGQEDLKIGLKNLFEDPQMTSLLSKRMETLAVLTKDKITDISIEYVYEGHKGTFQETRQTDSGAAEIVQQFKTTRPHLLTAYRDPEKLKKEIEVNEELMRNTKEGTTGESIVIEIKELG
jgi:glutamine synthetase adenylyltransferase